MVEFNGIQDMFDSAMTDFLIEVIINALKVNINGVNILDQIVQGFLAVVSV